MSNVRSLVRVTRIKKVIDLLRDLNEAQLFKEIGTVSFFLLLLSRYQTRSQSVSHQVLTSSFVGF